MIYKYINYIIELYYIIVKLKLYNMNFDLKVTHLFKEDGKREDKDMYSLKLKTYNGQVEGKFEKSEIRHIIEILDNAI